MITPGAFVVCRQTGAIAWIVERQEAGGRWRVVSKGIDDRGRAVFNSRTAGQGDLVVIAPAPTFEVGEAIEHDGLEHIVTADNGDTVTLTVPTSRRPLRGGGFLSLASGNSITVSKADLALEYAK